MLPYKVLSNFISFINSSEVELPLDISLILLDFIKHEKRLIIQICYISMEITNRFYTYKLVKEVKLENDEGMGPSKEFP